ncbi:uncharacterized protein LOC121789088 isoform X1 [Salvia splendens]|uniref:uncharacterized protein LOC121789088 isoform X1 n=1 Tax=Salvia splendens TaxID=180675 RepID=UPI001C25D341|nr:uncharacterized protein LOC121789088 isoform X1 [Salvia splendens]
MGKFKDDHKLKSSSSSPRDESMSKSRRSDRSFEHHSCKGFNNFVGQKGRVPVRPKSWPVETDNTLSYPLTESNNNVEDYEISDDQRYTTEETKLLTLIYMDVSKDYILGARRHKVQRVHPGEGTSS